MMILSGLPWKHSRVSALHRSRERADAGCVCVHACGCVCVCVLGSWRSAGHDAHARLVSHSWWFFLLQKITGHIEVILHTCIHAKTKQPQLWHIYSARTLWSQFPEENSCAGITNRVYNRWASYNRRNLYQLFFPLPLNLFLRRAGLTLRHFKQHSPGSASIA